MKDFGKGIKSSKFPDFFESFLVSYKKVLMHAFDKNFN